MMKSKIRLNKIRININEREDYVMKKKIKKNKFFQTIMVVIMGVFFLTTATYAWFSLTNAPKVNNLVLKAGTSGNLLISNERTTGFSDSISLELDGECCLRPLTTVNGKTFYRPVYAPNGMVESISATPISGSDLDSMANKVETKGGWLIKKTFYLKATVKDLATVDVRLMAPIQTRESGTVISNVNKNAHGAEAVRVSFTYDNTTVVLEPNANATTEAENVSQKALDGWKNMPVIKQGTNYKFSDDNGRTYTSDVSANLFDIPTNKPVEVTMYIWLEGADKDCVNEIMGNSINVELRFISEDII